MSYKILEQNGIDNENIDGGALNNLSSGGKDGILKGVLSECNLVAEGNTVSISTGVIMIHGFRVKLTEAEMIRVSSSPASPTRYQLIAQIILSGASVGFSMFLQQPATLIQQNFYESGNGIYQVEIGRITHNPDGSISDVQKTIDTISGGGTGTSSIEIGNVSTVILDPGLPAEVDIDKRVEDGKEVLDFKFSLPEVSYTLPVASETVLGGVKPVSKTVDMVLPVGVDSEGTLWVEPSEIPNNSITEEKLSEDVKQSLGKADTALQSIPIATQSAVGGVKPASKTTEMTQPVGVDSNGALWTKEASEGTTVVANPTATGTQDLTSLQVGGTVYNIPQGGGGITKSTVIERPEALPTATADSPDFVQTPDGTLYRKKAVEGAGLVGTTYTFKNSLSALITSSNTFNLSFTITHRTSYSSIKVNKAGWSASLNYDDTEVWGSPATEDADFYGWKGDVYKEITITNISSLTNVDEFVSFINSVATSTGGGASVSYEYVAQQDAGGSGGGGMQGVSYWGITSGDTTTTLPTGSTLDVHNATIFSAETLTSVAQMTQLLSDGKIVFKCRYSSQGSPAVFSSEAFRFQFINGMVYASFYAKTEADEGLTSIPYNVPGVSS